MSGNSHSGGHNKTHGKYEDVQRIDSFVIYRFIKDQKKDLQQTWTYEWEKNGKQCAAVDFVFDAEEDQIWMKYCQNGELHREVLKVSYSSNPYGGERMYFICPSCGRRVRYLCLTKKGFVCRRCGELNYRVQQSGRERILLDRIEKILHELEVETDFMNRWDMTTIFDGIERPRYMRTKKFAKLMIKLYDCQQEYWFLQNKKLKNLIG